MPAQTPGPGTPTALDEDSWFLDALVLYEDLATAVRAGQTLASVLPTPMALGPFSPKLWKVSLLKDPLLLEQAALEAGTADLILLSVHGRDALGGRVWNWMQCWQRHRSPRPCAFALLLDQPPPLTLAPDPTTDCIRRLAESAGADFFCGFSQPPATLPVWSPPAATAPASQESPRTRRPSRWGLNE